MSHPKIKFKQSKNVEELNQIYNVHPELTNFHLSYVYDPRLKLWEFVGYKCCKCEKTFKKADTLPNHVDNCHALKRTRRYGTVEIDSTAKVLTTNRNSWLPFDMNQK